MVDPTQLSRVGSDAFWRQPQDRTAQLGIQLAKLQRSIGANGFTFSTQSLVIKGDGQIIGEGTGTLDWSGPAHFGGDTTIDGTLNLAAGIVGDDALASQITTDAARQNNNSHTPDTTWSTGASVSLSRPEWATSAVITASGFLLPTVSASAGSPYCLMRIVTDTDISPESGMIGGDPPFPISLTWPTKLTSPPSTVFVSVQSKASAAGQYNSGTAAIGAVVQWYR